MIINQLLFGDIMTNGNVFGIVSAAFIAVAVFAATKSTGDACLQDVGHGLGHAPTEQPHVTLDDL